MPDVWYFDLQLRPWPTPRRFERTPGHWTLPELLRVEFVGIEPADDSPVLQTLRDDLGYCLGVKIAVVPSGQRADLQFILDKNAVNRPGLPAEGYALMIAPSGASVVAADERGLLYGVHSFVQIAGISRVYEKPRELTCCHVIDWPHFPFRSFMLDLGRVPFTEDLLRRCIRLASRLKYNVLHLHLHDNELNPVRYPGTALGSENPWALELSQYASLIDYARAWGLTIIPEIESWGHTGSLLAHYPHLYGATRRHGYGHSLAIGRPTLDLLAMLYESWIRILPDDSIVHVGLDEGTWKLSPGSDPAEFSRTSWISHVHNTLMSTAQRCGKRVRMMMWWDTVAIPAIPADLRPHVILEPWSYHTNGNPRVIEDIVWRTAMRPAAYVPDHKPDAPLVCGMGVSATCEAGGFAASRRWMELVKASPNVRGGDACLWGTNDVAGKLVTLFGAAEAMWSPDGFNHWYGPTLNDEDVHSDVSNRMRAWQSFSADADPVKLTAAQGAEVLMGRYRWGPELGKPVLPVWSPAQALRGDQAQ